MLKESPESDVIRARAGDTTSKLDASVFIQEELIDKQSTLGIQFPPPVSFRISTKDGVANKQMGDNLLVIGGTDGSGSRRIVSLLVSLGVPVVSEDPETYDIHADSVGGWPTFVKPLIYVSYVDEI